MQQLGNGVATLIAGGILIGIIASVLWRFKKGVSYWSTPAAKFTRAEDPFSYWLSMIVPVVLPAFLLIAGVCAVLYPVVH